MKKIKTSLSDRASLKRVMPDGMPVEVANEILLDPLAAITMPFRKAALDARANHYVPTTIRKPAELKLAAKLKTASLAQLGKWYKRSITRRLDCQRAYLRIEGNTRQHNALRAALDVAAARHDTLRDAIETELKSRGVSVSK